MDKKVMFKTKMKSIFNTIVLVMLLIALTVPMLFSLTGCEFIENILGDENDTETTVPDDSGSTDGSSGNVNGDNGPWVLPPVPANTADTGSPVEDYNGGQPAFTASELQKAEKRGYFIDLKDWDELGRTQVAVGCFDKAHMPTFERESLATKPSGWVQKRYPADIVSGGWLYNRAHELGFQISGLQDEKRNLVTGTRAMNVDYQLPFENIVADHLREYDDHKILYRVTPVYDGNNLLPSGLILEADCLDCDDIDYGIYVRNVQPGIDIDYATGNSQLHENK